MAYVVPGSHTVTFLNGAEIVSKTDVVVDAGEEKEVQPPAPPPRAFKKVHEVSRPYSPIVLYVGAGLTLVSIVVPIYTYVHASQVGDRYDQTDVRESKQVDDAFAAARKKALAAAKAYTDALSE